MPVTVEWYNPEHNIIHFQFIAPWTWTDYGEADHHAREMMDTVQHKVEFILNFERMRHLPSNSFLHLRRAANDVHRNQGMIVIIGVNVLVRTLGNVMEAVYPRIAKDRRLAADLQEAEHIIAETQQQRIQANGSLNP
jgi:hypothetical protein